MNINNRGYKSLAYWKGELSIDENKNRYNNVLSTFEKNLKGYLRPRKRKKT